MFLMQDTRKYSGMVAGMEYPYFALLINQTEDGIGYFHLVQPKLSLKILLEKLVLDKNSFTFLKNEDIVSIKVKKFGPFNSKRKSIAIKTKDNEMKLYLNEYEVEEKIIEKHKDMLLSLINDTQKELLEKVDVTS